MAGTCTSIRRHVIGSTAVELSGIPTRSGASFSARISMETGGASARCGERQLPQVSAEGPSCIFVGPIENASKETLEALYRQAPDAYYSGEPLIVDDMFDRVELKLRWYSSKSVVKYPRCRVLGDNPLMLMLRLIDMDVGQEDISQVFALAIIWIIFLAFGCSALIGPIIYTVVLAYQGAFSSGISHGSQASMIQFLATVNGILFMAVGSLIGYPVASASGNYF